VPPQIAYVRMIRVDEADANSVSYEMSLTTTVQNGRKRYVYRSNLSERESTQLDEPTRPVLDWRETWCYPVLKRILDITLAFGAAALLVIPMILTAALIRLTSRGPAMHWSRRIGKNNVEFLMPKFRTMRIDVPQVATHLLPDPDAWITAIGALLRRTSMDELPQLYSILKGQLSFVGPRPALFNQDELIALRSEQQIHKLVPGLTGWAQVNGRHKLTIQEKVQLDREYLERRCLLLDLAILVKTFAVVICGYGISH
jgi:O-antigen biosynthesis protein WbqP